MLTTLCSHVTMRGGSSRPNFYGFRLITIQSFVRACETGSEWLNKLGGTNGPTSLHFSPRGEAKCVRGPSGRGASLAEEKGARNMAFKVFHESRITAFYRVLRPSGGENCRIYLERFNGHL